MVVGGVAMPAAVVVVVIDGSFCTVENLVGGMVRINSWNRSASSMSKWNIARCGVGEAVPVPVVVGEAGCWSEPEESGDGWTEGDGSRVPAARDRGS